MHRIFEVSHCFMARFSTDAEGRVLWEIRRARHVRKAGVAEKHLYDAWFKECIRPGFQS
jgi:hypothetical protein